MKQNKFFQLWSFIMAKVTRQKIQKDQSLLPKIFIEPTTNEEALSASRIKEIQDLVAEIIILGLKRGRPARKDEELKDVA